MSARWLLLCVCCVLGGCALMPVQPGCVKVGPFGSACPLPPSMLPAVSANHIVTIERDGERSQTVVGRLQIDAHALRLAAASLFGTQLFTLTYDGDKVTGGPVFKAMPEELLVVMLEVAIADPVALRPHLHGMRLTVEHNAQGEIRELSEKGREVVRVVRSAGPLADARFVIRIASAGTTIKLAPIGSTG